MNTLSEIQQLLNAQLGDAYPAASFEPLTPLIGEIPEFDSMAVVGLLTAIEDTFGISIGDDEVSADAFETVGSLVAFVEAQSADAG